MTEIHENTKIIKIRTIFGRNCKVSEDRLLSYAKDCINNRFLGGESLTSSAKTRAYLKLLIGEHEREMFYVIWLNNQHQVVKHGVLFQGTIDGAAVYPREIVKEGLACNAAACILAHNHPSGESHPSQADIAITRKIKEALSVIDIRTLDHIVVGKNLSSMAELGLM
ncbi:MAG: DNA repair protein RadC [marine bacterium B5-7]|nr:MAG: DNA repair protein RadC [marine bacterium B5-7]